MADMKLYRCADDLKDERLDPGRLTKHGCEARWKEAIKGKRKQPMMMLQRYAAGMHGSFEPCRQCKSPIFKRED